MNTNRGDMKKNELKSPIRGQQHRNEMSPGQSNRRHNDGGNGAEHNRVPSKHKQLQISGMNDIASDPNPRYYNAQIQSPGNNYNSTGSAMPITSPRNAIGGISGVPASSQQYASNVMNRRKSNAIGGSHGPVDLSQIMRAQRTGRNDNEEPQPRKGNQSRGKTHQSLNVNGKNQQNEVYLTSQVNNHVYLPPMPLTPTEEQLRQNKMQNNTSPSKASHMQNKQIYPQNAAQQDKQKMKLVYKKQINSHRDPTQSQNIGGLSSPVRDIATHRTNAQQNLQSSQRQPHQKVGVAAVINYGRDNSNAPQERAYNSNTQQASSIVQSHSYNSNTQRAVMQPTKHVPVQKQELDIEALLLGQGPPPDPAALNLPCWEPTKCSVRENGSIIGYAANTNQGIIRDYNEDRVSIVLNIMQPPTKKDIENWPKCSFFGVFDGHGGNTCADFLRDNLHQFIIKDAQFPQNPRQAIINGYKKAEIYFLDTVDSFASGRQHMLDRSGSCAIVALLIEKKIFIVNVGDSRAIMSSDGGNYCVNLSIDHKPNDDGEQKRILEHGGRVYQTQTIARGDQYKQVQTITYQPGQDNSAVLQQAESREENPNIIYGPYRVFPGRLSVSRTFGDIEAKREKFGGNPNVVIATPEIKEFMIDDKMDFLLLGCDGIFDKISNAEVVKQAWIASKKNFHHKDQSIHQICGYVVEQVMKASVAYKTLDNITVVLLAFKNFKLALSEEFVIVNKPVEVDIQSKESGGQVGGSGPGEEQQRAQNPVPAAPVHNSNPHNAPIENPDSSNGGLVFSENTDISNLAKEDIKKVLSLPNIDVNFDDIEKMTHKPRMPKQKRSGKVASRHGSKDVRQAPLSSGSMGKSNDQTSNMKNRPTIDTTQSSSTASEEGQKQNRQQIYAQTGIQPNSKRNSSSRRFNMRVGNSIQPTGQESELNAKGHQSPQNRNGTGLQPNLHTQRDKSLNKRQMQMQKYKDGETPKESDLNLPYPGPAGNINSQNGAKSSGYRSNRNSNNETGQYLMPNSQRYEGPSNQRENWAQNMQQQRGSHISNINRRKIVSGPGQSVLLTGGAANNNFEGKIRHQKQSNSMLNPQGVYKGKHESSIDTGIPANQDGQRMGGNPLSAGQAQQNTLGLQMTQDGALNNSSFFPQEAQSHLSYGGTKPGSTIFSKRNNSRPSKSRGNNNKTPNVQDINTVGKGTKSISHGQSLTSSHSPNNQGQNQKQHKNL